MWTASFPGCVGCCQRNLLLLAPSRILRLAAWLRVREELEQQPEIRRYHRNVDFLTTSQAPSGSQSMSHSGRLTCWSPQEAHRHPQYSIGSPTHLPHDQLPVHVPENSKYKFSQIVMEDEQKASPTLWDWEKTQICTTLWKANGSLLTLGLAL